MNILPHKKAPTYPVTASKSLNRILSLQEKSQIRREFIRRVVFAVYMLAVILLTYTSYGTNVEVFLQDYMIVKHFLLLVGLAGTGLCVLQKDRRYRNWFALIYGIVYHYILLNSGQSSSLGVVGMVLGVTLTFYFMDMAYACILNYSFVGMMILCFGNAFPFEGAIMMLAPMLPLYILTLVVTSMICTVMEIEIRRVTYFRNESLRLAIQYCDELEEARESEEKSRIEAEQANKAKSLFLSNMSHDIRTPMNAIVGYAELMKENVGEPQKERQYADRILVSAGQLENLVNDVLDMSRIEADKETYHPSPEHLLDVCQEIGITVYPMGVQNDIHLSSEAINIKHNYVMLEKKKLHRILLNVVSNSIKYTERGGSVSCTVEEKESPHEGYRTYIFTIKDTGIGMSEDFQKHIFESFAREESAENNRIAGTGLGMAIVKKYVDLMGGKIVIKSQPNVGTEVRVSLEFEILPEDGTAEIPGVSAGSEVTLKGLHILLAEDSAINRELTTEFLEEEGSIVDSATNGQEAVDKFRESPEGTYDLILTDVRMPVMDGVTEARIIRAMEREDARTIPIIAFSANVFIEDIEKSLRAGMNAHIAKPINITELRNILSTICR